MIIVLAYVWAGLTEAAAIVAVALNKLPIASSHRARGGARARPNADRDGGRVPHEPVAAAASPRPAAACALSRGGRALRTSLVWKIALIVELLGRPNGVGFEIGVAFQLFDVTRILAYALVFIAGDAGHRNLSGAAD